MSVDTGSQYDSICENMVVQLYDRIKFLEDPKRFKLTSSECASLRLTWNAFIAGEPSKRGFDMFTRMFDNVEDTRKYFSFAQTKVVDQMKASGKLLFHVNRVVAYITKAVDAASNLEDVVPLLKQVGRRHGKNGYNIEANHFQHLGVAMIQLMDESIKLNGNQKAIWEKFFAFIIKCLQDGQTAYGELV